MLACCSTGLFFRFGYRHLPYCWRQSDFDSWTDERAFDGKAWIDKSLADDCGGVGVRYLRGTMIVDLNKRYSLEKMTPGEIRDLLGPPEKRRKLKGGLVAWGYELGAWENNQGNYLSLVFNGGKVHAQNYNEFVGDY